MKLKFLAKIESNIKIKTNLKTQNYNNPDKRIWLEEEDMLNEMIGVADPDRVCSDEALTANSTCPCLLLF